MFGIGFFEAIVLAAVGLLVLGPEQFPKFAKMAARFVRDIRSYANEVQTEIAKDLIPLRKEFNDLRKIDPEKYLDKLIQEDEEDTRPPNPEPHPSEVDLGAPVPGNYQSSTSSSSSPEEAPAPDSTVQYGEASKAREYPQEEDVPPTPKPATVEPERLDG